jgi:hypothetical protein
MPPKIKKNNKNHSHNTSVPQNRKSGTIENGKVSPSITFGIFEKTWDIFWVSFPGSLEQLEEHQVNACLEIIQECQSKGVEFPSPEASSFSFDEAKLAWYSIKYAELMGLGGAQ